MSPHLTGLLPVIVLVVLGVAGLGLGGIVAAGRRRWPEPLVALRLEFPAGMTAAAATEFLAGLSGLTVTWWRRPFRSFGVVFETSGTRDGVSHHLLASPVHLPLVQAALHAALPGAVARIDADYESLRPRLAASLATSSALHPLASNDKGAVSRAVLASLQPLGAGERIVLQWVLSPTGPRPRIQAAGRDASGPAGIVGRLLAPAPLRPDELRSLREKQATPMFIAAGRLGVEAPTRGGARHLLGRLIGALTVANAPGVHLRQRLIPGRLTRRAVTEHRPLGLTYPCLLSAAELTGLLALPVGEISLPGVRLATSRLFMPAADLVSAGRIIGDATFSGMERPVALSVRDSLRHSHVLGPTGSGKSTLLVGMITQDIQAGRGVIVIDPKSDLVADVLDRVPPERTRDVIVLDPKDTRPVGLNLLAPGGMDPRLIAELVLAMFYNLFKAFWGPRTDDILRAALLTLLANPGQTICEIPLLLSDESYRRRMTAAVDDPIGLGPFWSWFNGLVESERTQVIGPVANKLRAFIMREHLRNVFGQATPALDISEVLAQGKILLVPLSKGELGQGAAKLLGTSVFSRIWQSTLYRVSLPQDQRPTVMCYIDEIQDVLDTGVDLPDLLAQARGLGLGLTLAHQHLGQLSPELRAAVLTNTRSRIAFQLAASDAATVAREMAPVTAADLQGLGAYQVLASLSAGNRVAPPVSLSTRPAPPSTGSAETVRQLSRQGYGVAREDIDREIRARHQRPDSRPTVGRREVTS